jgi:hypothetical protein
MTLWSCQAFGRGDLSGARAAPRCACGPGPRPGRGEVMGWARHGAAVRAGLVPLAVVLAPASWRSGWR